MNNLVKYGLWAAAFGGLLYIGKKASDAKQLAKGISYKIVDFGLPKISGNVLSVPLRLQIQNATQLTQVIDSVTVALSLLQKQQYIEVGGATINNISITPGTSYKDFTAQVDLNKLTTNFFDTLSTVFQSSAITLKANVLITVNRVTLPPQVLTKEIRV